VLTCYNNSGAGIVVCLLQFCFLISLLLQTYPFVLFFIFTIVSLCVYSLLFSTDAICGEELHWPKEPCVRS